MPNKKSHWTRLQDKIHQYKKSAPNDTPYTPRTTSIPRTIIDTPSSASTLTYSISTDENNEPPKITQPFLYKPADLSPPKSKKIINTQCCFCDELLSSTLFNEKIIELTCGHITHEECLFLLLEMNDNSKDYYSILPKCELCHKQAIPKDESITDSIISRYLISSNNHTHHHNYQNNQLLSPLPTPKSNSNEFDHHGKYRSLSLSKKNSKDLSIHIPKRSIYHNKNVRNYTKSRGSSISATSSIVSSVPKTPDELLSINNTTNKGDLMRSNLLLNLTNNFLKNNKKIRIDYSFGNLRLVDKLKISENNQIFTEFIVYLFQNTLLLVDLSFMNYWIYELPSKPKISTPNSRTLKLLLVGDKPLFITHENDKILQKWIAGLCDYEFIFNSPDISSTLKLFNNELKDVNCIDSIISNESIQEEVEHFTIPVLLSPMTFKDDKAKKKSEDIIKFHKTENLILIIDHSHSINKETLITLKNISKVLATKFNNKFSFIYTYEFDKVLKCGRINEIESMNENDDFTNVETKTINEAINELIDDGKSNDYSLLIISNSNISKPELLKLSILNQLVMLIQNHSNMDITFGNSDIIKLNSWDKIMEVLINKLDLDFYNDDDFNDDFDSDEFNSDNYENDYESEKEDMEDMEQTEIKQNEAKWSILFNDINEALMETMK